jgi:hypothetical protein
MTPLAIGPVLALLGIVAAFFVLRRKAKTRKSMYRTLRERRELDLRKARERATAAKGAVERTAVEREEAAQAAAAPPVGPSSAAALPTPAQDAPPAYAAPTPAYTPQEPTYLPPEPLPEPPPAPVEQVPAEVLPAPPPTAGDQTRPAWEIVQPDKPEAEDVHTAGAGSAGPGKASWELAPGEQERIDDRRKGRGRHDDDEEEDETGEESLAQVLLSYAGLVAALLVILFGIFLMIGGRGPN